MTTKKHFYTGSEETLKELGYEEKLEGVYRIYKKEICDNIQLLIFTAGIKDNLRRVMNNIGYNDLVDPHIEDLISRGLINTLEEDKF